MLHSEQLKLTERLAINPETGVLVLTWTANNPRYFTGPFPDRQELVRTDYKVSEYNCVIEEERGSDK